MIQVSQVAIATPLAVGAGAVLCTIFIHALAFGATVNFFRRELRLKHTGTYLIDFAIVVQVIIFPFVAHVLEVALYAWLFMICGEFRQFAPTFITQG